MSDVSAGTISLDLGPYLAQITEAEKSANLLAEAAKAAGESSTKAFAQAASVANQYNAGLATIIVETRAGANAQRQFATEIAGLVKEIRDQAAAQDAARKAGAAAADERRKANTAAREASKTEKQAAKEVEQAQKAAAAAAKQAAKESQDSAKSSSGAFSVIKGAIAGLGIGAAIAAFKQFTSNVIEAGRAADATLGKLKFANSGNIQAAARDLAFVRNEADRLGLELNSTGNSYGSFTAAAQAANFPLAEARRLFLATAGASAELKLSAEDNQGVLLAFTQILSKGNVQAEELRGQIGERLPGAFAIAARAMGVTEKELNKLLQTGQVASADFLPKFARELEKTFGDGSATAAEAFGANLNRIDNEFQAFYLRFQATAGGVAGAAATFFKSINERFDSRTEAGREALGAKNAQESIKAYQEFVELLFGQVAKAAQRGGRDVNAEIKQAVDVQAAELKRQAEQAEANIALLRRPRQGGFLNDADPTVIDFLKKQGRKFEPFNEGAEQDAVRKEEINQQRIKKAAEGQLAILGQLATARTKANKKEVDQLGLIAKQEELIKQLKERQKFATQEKQSEKGDFLLGKGGLDEQLATANKELDRLQGKVEKAKKEADKLTPALRALAEERARLTEAAAKANIDEANDTRERSRLQFEEDLRHIEIIKQKILERERAVGKAGGRGGAADGAIGPKDQALLDTLARKAQTDRLDRDFAAAQKASEYTNSLRELTDQQERDNLAAQYEAEAKLIRDNEDQRFLLREKYLRAAAELEFQINKRNSEREAEYSRANASRAVGEVYGTQGGIDTGVSRIEAARSEAELLLQIEAKAAQDQIDNAANLEDRLKKDEIEAGLARLARVKNQIKDIEAEKAKHKADDFVFKLLFGSNDSTELRNQFEQTAQQVIGTINNILSAQLAAEQQKIQAHDQNISSLTASLQGEIALRQEGSASNIRRILTDLEAEKAAKRESLAESRRIAKQQQLINDLATVSSLSLAVANIIAGWSTVPLAGSLLGLVAAAATVAGFVAQKSAATNAAKSSGEGFFKGGRTGGSSITEERGVVHGKEMVFDHQKTQTYGAALFDPLHAGRPQDIDWSHPALAAILPSPTMLALPTTLRAEKAEAQRHQATDGFAPMKAEFGQMHNRLQAIEKSNERMANRWDTHATEDGITMVDPETGSVHKISMT